MALSRVSIMYDLLHVSSNASSEICIPNILLTPRTIGGDRDSSGKDYPGTPTGPVPVIF